MQKKKKPKETRTDFKITNWFASIPNLSRFQIILKCERREKVKENFFFSFETEVGVITKEEEEKKFLTQNKKNIVVVHVYKKIMTMTLVIPFTE